MNITARDTALLIDSLKARRQWYEDDEEANDKFRFIIDEDPVELFNNLIKKFESLSFEIKEVKQ